MYGGLCYFSDVFSLVLLPWNTTRLYAYGYFSAFISVSKAGFLSLINSPSFATSFVEYSHVNSFKYRVDIGVSCNHVVSPATYNTNHKKRSKLWIEYIENYQRVTIFIKFSEICTRRDWSERVHSISVKHAPYVTRVHCQDKMHVGYVISTDERAQFTIHFIKEKKTCSLYIVELYEHLGFFSFFF